MQRRSIDAKVCSLTVFTSPTDNLFAGYLVVDLEYFFEPWKVVGLDYRGCVVDNYPTHRKLADILR